MSPVTHGLVAWVEANLADIERRDRLLVLLAGLVPDLDGLAVLGGADAYRAWHHILCHNLLAALLFTGIVLAVARRRLLTGGLAFLGYHIHLACDYVGSAGPDGEPWVLPYLYPFVGEPGPDGFAGPSWYLNPLQWRLDAWPNFVVTGVAVLVTGWVAVRLHRTFLEFVSPRLDDEVCITLRRRLGGRRSERWETRERRVLAAGFALAVLALAAGVALGVLAATGPGT